MYSNEFFWPIFYKPANSEYFNFDLLCIIYVKLIFADLSQHANLSSIIVKFVKTLSQERFCYITCISVADPGRKSCPSVVSLLHFSVALLIKIYDTHT